MDSWEVKRGSPEWWVLLGIGSVTGLIGLLVIWGWFSGNRTLIQVSPQFAAMQFNTACSIAMAGAALISFGMGWRKTVLGLGIAVGAVGLLTGVEYLFHLNLGIDQLLFTYNLEVPVDHPGRMAPNTAASFWFLGMALVALTRRDRPIFSDVALIAACVGLGIPAVSLFGYWMGLESALGWATFTRMALHTAMSLTLLFCGVVGSQLFYAARQTRLRLAFPIGIMLALMIGTLAIWQAFRTQNFITIQRIAEDKRDALVGISQENINESLDSLNRMADRFGAVGGFSEALWSVDARNYVRQLPALHTLEYYDQEGQVLGKSELGMQPGEPEPPVLFHELPPESQTALKMGQSTMLRSPHKRHAYYYMPIFVLRQFSGYIVATIDIIDLVVLVVQQLALGNYQVSLLSDGTVLYLGGALHSPLLGRPIEGTFRVADLAWQVQVQITSSAALSELSPLNHIMLLLGSALSCLGGLIVYFWQKIRGQNRVLEVSNEQLIRATAKAEEAAVAKGVFLATMSHEIRTPLNAVLGTVELLAETKIDETQKRYLDRILHSSKTLLALISEVLDFSKMEGGAVTLNLAPADLQLILKSVADTLFLKAKEKGLEVWLDLPPDLSIPVVVDALRLQQIVSNLGTNALKYTETGSVVIRAQVLAKEGDKARLRIEVEDTGIGIAEEDQKKLFQTFTQLEGARVRKYGGVGLGLSIGKKLVELMGGTIGLTSTLGKGSLFWVEIPVTLGVSPQQGVSPIAGKEVALALTADRERAMVARILTAWGAKLVEGSPATPRGEVLVLSEDQVEAYKGWQMRKVLLTSREGGPLPEGITKAIVRPVAPRDLWGALS